MKKWLVKLELIAEWILLIAWFTYVMLVYSLSFLVIPENMPGNHRNIDIINNAIIILMCIAISANLIINTKSTKKYLKQEQVVTINLPNTKYKILIFITSILLVIFWVMWILPEFSFCLAMCSRDSTFEEMYPDHLIFAILIYGITLFFINTLPALRKLFNNKKLNIFNITCLVCSAIIIIIFLILLIAILLKN